MTGTELEGIADFNVEATVPGITGAEVTLSGSLDITATLDLSLSFGVDSKGFFVVAGATNAPRLTITGLGAGGQVAGFGRFGFLGFELDAATVSLDPGVEIACVMADPQTQAADGLIRIPELSAEDFTQLIAVEVAGDGDDYLDDDVVITGNFGVGLLAEGLEEIVDLADAQLTIRWPDMLEPDVVEISAATAAGQAYFDFFRIDPQLVAEQIVALAGHLSVFNIDLPFLRKDAGELGGFEDKTEPVKKVWSC